MTVKRFPLTPEEEGINLPEKKAAQRNFWSRLKSIPHMMCGA